MQTLTPARRTAHDASFWGDEAAISVGGWEFVGASDNSRDCRFSVAIAIS
jgi:hypothetical protein